MGSHLTVAVVAAVIAPVPVATAAAVVITTGAPAWLTGRAPVVEALRYE